MTEVKLINVRTELHWQLAYQAATEAVRGEKVDLTYETPEGDISLTANWRYKALVIRRHKCPQST